MVIKHKDIPIIFDRIRFANDLREWFESSGLTIREVDEILERKATFGNLMSVNKAYEDWRPRLKTIEIVCYLAGLNPADYWGFEDMVEDAESDIMRRIRGRKITEGISSD